MRSIEPIDCRDPRVLVAVGFGSGFAARAPGTAGSIAALAIWWMCIAPLAAVLQVAVIGVATVLGIYCVASTCRVTGVGDDSRIVVDEWLGTWIALIAAPRHWAPAAIAFGAFRLFDIWKPWPIGWIDRRVGGGLGIVLDDLIAGGLALAVLQLSIAAWRLGAA